MNDPAPRGTATDLWKPVFVEPQHTPDEGVWAEMVRNHMDWHDTECPHPACVAYRGRVRNV